MLEGHVASRAPTNHKQSIMLYICDGVKKKISDVTTNKQKLVLIAGSLESAKLLKWGHGRSQEYALALL